MSPPIRLAFLGCGSVTRRHSRTLRAFPGEVTCLYASRDRARAIAYDRRFGGAGAFDDYQAALHSDRVDAVLIALPPAYHLHWTLLALWAGKHVIVEKPPFVESTQFDVVEQAIRETGRRVFVAENYFYKPLARRLRGIIASGTLGEIRHIQVDARKYQRARGWRSGSASPEGDAVGALFEGGIHWVDLMANLGLPVKSVRGQRLDGSSGPERHTVVRFEYQGGATGLLNHSWNTRSPLGPIRLSRIIGTGGTVTFESNGLFLLLRGAERRLWLLDWSDAGGYRAMFADFLHALATRKEPEFTLAHARRDLELVEAASASGPGALAVTSL